MFGYFSKLKRLKPKFKLSVSWCQIIVYYIISDYIILSNRNVQRCGFIQSFFINFLFFNFREDINDKK